MKALTYLMAALLSAGLLSVNTAHAQRRGYDCSDCGTVVSVQQIRHKDKHLGAGTAIGAVAGGLLGSNIGRGSGRTAATVAGAVAGGAVGHSVEKSNRRARYGWRFSVRLDDGRHVTVIQRDNPDIRRGDRVRVSGDHLYRY